MEKKIYAGERLRRLREAQGMSQVALARLLGLSPSYVNQMESNQRPMSATVLTAAAQHFDVPPTYFADAEDVRAVADIREMLTDPLFQSGDIGSAEMRAMVRAAPKLAGQFLTLYRAYRTLADELTALRETVAHGDHASPVAPFPYDEVRDYIQSKQNYIDVLDRAAETLAENRGFRQETLASDLTHYLRDRHGVDVRLDDSLAHADALWHFDATARQLTIAETTRPSSRSFYLAYAIALLEQAGVIEHLVTEARFSSDAARSIARVGLANYFAGALCLPYGAFLGEACRVGYDIEQLQSRFAASFEQVCHRLSTMQRPDAPGVPFYFVKVDLAGNVTKRSSATRFQFARFGGACPLWSVHQAFAQPNRILVQIVETPDGQRYLSIARTVRSGGGAFHRRPREFAVELGCDVAHAHQLVYAAGLDLNNPAAAVPVGSSCRICERLDCHQRAVPPAGMELAVHPDLRRTLPYSVSRRAPGPR